MTLTIGKKKLQSRLFLGTARYPSLAVLRSAITASETEVITVSLRREQANQGSSEAFWDFLQSTDTAILPNTAGASSADEAIKTAHLARSLFKTDWIKLEVIGCHDTLAPDPFHLVIAAQELVKEGFTVLPYTTDDVVLGRKLLEVGCTVLMPWASPIGTGQGIRNPAALSTYRQKFPDVTLIVDAGLGKPSDAAIALELGFDGVLVNTAVAEAQNPALMAKAFATAVKAGRLGYEAGVMRERHTAQPSTPMEGLPFHGL